MFGWHFCWKHKLFWEDSDEMCQICWCERNEKEIFEQNKKEQENDLENGR